MLSFKVFKSSQESFPVFWFDSHESRANSFKLSSELLIGSVHSLQKPFIELKRLVKNALFSGGILYSLCVVLNSCDSSKFLIYCSSYCSHFVALLFLLQYTYITRKYINVTNCNV
ncbi:MAG TPA: hypothetical protein VGK06_04440 [Methanosarcina sp.]